MKVDDLSIPYHAHEIEMIRKAIDKCGRPDRFQHIARADRRCARRSHQDARQHVAHLRRFLGSLAGSESRSSICSPNGRVSAGRGIGPTVDMIPFGHIGIKCTIAGPERQTRFTQDEQMHADVALGARAFAAHARQQSAGHG